MYHYLVTCVHLYWIGIDLWRNAYRRDYGENRLNYLVNIWKVVNWEKV